MQKLIGNAGHQLAAFAIVEGFIPVHQANGSQAAQLHMLFHEHNAHAQASRSQSRRHTSHTAAGHDHIRAGHYGNLPFFFNEAH